MEIIHVSAECYPVAKIGGLADVVGALPKYQCETGAIAKVVMPCYHTAFLFNNEFDLVHQDGVWLGPTWYHFNVLKEKYNTLGFDLYLIDIPGLLDTEGVYGYWNDTERFLAFQIATLDWIDSWAHQPDIIHCHDHHTALVPFMMGHANKYHRLRTIPSVLTIHNAQYQGQFGWDHLYYLPGFNPWDGGLLGWDGCINSLAAGIKSCWALTTVSPNYMDELAQSANGLESLIASEKHKSTGIINGIDAAVWDTATDTLIAKNYNPRNVVGGKQANKEALCERFGLNPDKPLFSFIGRLVYDKGADLLPDIIRSTIAEMEGELSFLLLGSGNKHYEWLLDELKKGPGSENFGLFLGYDEALSHEVYAGSDFLIMPSRVEPCGLNQLYALQYGTIPIVRSVGGLIDTVKDIGDEDGFGFRFMHAAAWEVSRAARRANQLYQDKKLLNSIRRKIMKFDHSWYASAQQYLDLYDNLK